MTVENAAKPMAPTTPAFTPAEKKLLKLIQKKNT